MAATAEKVREYNRQYRERNRERIRERNRLWVRNNPEKAAHAIRTANLMANYGMTPVDYDAMLAAQGGGCAICGTTDPAQKRARFLAVDHCHTTGRIRGLLCFACNRHLGAVEKWYAKYRAKVDDYMATPRTRFVCRTRGRRI